MKKYSHASFPEGKRARKDLHWLLLVRVMPLKKQQCPYFGTLV